MFALLGLIVILGFFGLMTAALLVWYQDTCCNETEFCEPEDVLAENVHLFMAYDQTYADDFADRFAAINERYATKHGFQFHKFVLDKRPDEVPHYMRYRALQQLFPAHGPEAVFVYLDADAVVLNHQLDLRRWIGRTANVLTENTCPFKNLQYGFGFRGNSGFMVVRNTDTSRRFVDNVLNSETCRGNKQQAGYDQACISRLYQASIDDTRTCVRTLPRDRPVQKSHTDPTENTVVFDPEVPITHFTGPKHHLCNVQCTINE